MSTRAKSLLDTLSTLLVIAAAGSVLWKLHQPAPPSPAARPPVEDISELRISADALTHMRGKGDVVLVEFADYECPFCARHTRNTAPTIKAELIDSGAIQHVFFNFPLPIHSRAEKAAEAAECAGQQGKFWEMHQRLFDDPTALEVSDLLAKADALGLESAMFADCLDGGLMATRIRADQAQGRRLGVNSTPLFFVGTRQADGSVALQKRINGAVSVEIFKEAVRDISVTVRASR